MCSTGISFGRSKLLQSCSNLTFKPELEPTVIACLASRVVDWICPLSGNSKRSERLRFLPDICNADIQKTPYSAKTYTVLNGVLDDLQRESWSFGKNYPLSVLTINYNSPLLSLFASLTGYRWLFCSLWQFCLICIHTKLIIVCCGLGAVKKERDCS